jgi:hypothetical protein
MQSVTLLIVWQRLVKDGKTCDRCAETKYELDQTVAEMAPTLHPFRVEPRLEVREIDEAEFKASPAECNRIWIAGKPIEQWLNATVGDSPCGSVGGESRCRTVAVDGTTFDVIPKRLIVEAALLAASDLI